MPVNPHSNPRTNPRSNQPVVPANMLFTFALVTMLFPLWGFANDITNPMVDAFQKILQISTFKSALVQAAFYGGYCFMAIPAALFIRRYNYKKGILAGLFLYAAGCLLFIPSGGLMLFESFLLAYFIMTCGLAFLETTANPCILSLGPEDTATRRLNFSQAFNPLGSITGMLIARNFILARLQINKEKIEGGDIGAFASANPDAFAVMQRSDINVIVWPYLILGIVVLATFFVFLAARIKNDGDGEAGAAKAAAGPDSTIKAIVTRLFKNPCYVRGVVAQAFYVGVQIMVWTFIIQYAERELGLAPKTGQGYNMAAMIIFVSSRFICTYLLKYIRPSQLLFLLAVGGGLFTLGAILIKGMPGLYCLVGISACMSLMFPTIYGIALKGIGGDDAKLASAGLIFAIGGGCLMPPLQGLLIDKAHWFGNALSSVRVSFVLPLLCFVVIAAYAIYVKKHRPGRN